MKHRFIHIGMGFLFAFTFGFFSLNAQQAVVTTGGDIQSSEGSVAYSVGQVFYQSVSSPSGSVLEGVQQPFEIFIITSVTESDPLTELRLFPNPASDYLILETGDHLDPSVRMAVFNSMGQMIRTANVEREQTKVYVGDLMAGSYYVALFQDGRKLQTFKVIKK